MLSENLVTTPFKFDLGVFGEHSGLVSGLVHRDQFGTLVVEIKGASVYYRGGTRHVPVSELTAVTQMDMRYALEAQFEKAERESAAESIFDWDDKQATR